LSGSTADSPPLRKTRARIQKNPTEEKGKEKEEEKEEQEDEEANPRRIRQTTG